MKKSLALLLFVFISNGFSAPVENAMVDPTLMTDALANGIQIINATRQQNPLPTNNLTPENQQGLGDPTRMNVNFRDALNGIKNTVANPTGAPTAQAVQTPDSPAVTLMAKMTNNAKSRVTLRVNNKSEIVSEGDSITYFKGSELMTIEVDEITKNYVKVTIKPINQILILR